MSITKLVLTINNQEIIVTFDEAKNLYSELAEIFGPSQSNIRQKDIEKPWENGKWPNLDPSKFTD